MKTKYNLVRKTNMTGTKQTLRFSMEAEWGDIANMEEIIKIGLSGRRIMIVDDRPTEASAKE